MKAKATSKIANPGGKGSTAKDRSHASKAARVKRVRPLAAEQLLNIVEHINDGLVVLDKDWHYIYVNQKAATMLHRQKPSDLIGKHIWTEYPEGVGQPFHAAYEKAMREQVPLVFEDHYEPWDLWFENRIYPSPDSLLILFTEITDRKRIERLLNERQYFLQKILDTEPGTVYIYDLEERRNVYVNRHWLSEYGYTAEETQAMGDELLVRIIHPEDLEQIAAHHENWRQAMEGDIREIEYRIRPKTGEWRWVHSHEAVFTHDASGRVKQILGISYEVTPRRVAQEALRRSEQQLGLIYDTISDITFLLSIEPDERYRFISVNRAFLRATGLTADQVLGRYAEEIIPSDSQDLVFENYKKAIQEKTPITWEEVSKYPAGEKIVIVTVNAVYNEAGDCTHLVGALHDITERKQVEKALRESEEKFSKVFHVSPIPLSITRLSDGHYVEVNESFLDRLGYVREEILGRSPEEVGMWVHPKDRERMMRIMREQGSVRNFEAEFRTKSGQTGTALLFRDIIELAEDEYIIGTSLDITERKRMEEALRESEQRYQLISTITSDYMFSSRLDADGKLTLDWVTGAFESITGYSMEEYIAHGGWRSALHPQDLEIDDRALEQLRANKPVISELRTFTRDGKLVWVRVYAQPVLNLESQQLIGIYGAVQDITDRKQAEEALAASEAELRALFAAMNDVVLVIDSHGIYQEIAPTNPRLLYKPSEELLGKSMLDIFPTEQAISFINRIQWVIEKQEIAHIEYPLVIEGETYWFDASISPMESDRVLWMARDITGRKGTEEKLRQLNEDLERRVALRTEELAAAMVRAQESDRLKSAFLAAMSHELRTPLNSIIGFTGVLIQGLAGPLNEEQTKQLGMTRDSARHLLALINDVLDISKIEAGQLEIVKQPFDMHQAIESALRVVHPLAQKKKLPLSSSIGAEVGIINNDRRRVEQVLINLLNNAIKFTEHGEVHISCEITNGCLETSVRDNGIGIKPEDGDRLFKPFQQIDVGPARGHEGTGLGLAICKRLVTAMGGQITFESQWRLGSTFKFTLPI
jgi:PAS domain S-box-containing protein